MTKEIIYEFIPQGNFMKVTAVDVDTGIEASTITPRDLSEEAQKKAAYNKLVYVMEKKIL